MPQLPGKRGSIHEANAACFGCAFKLSGLCVTFHHSIGLISYVVQTMVMQTHSQNVFDAVSHRYICNLEMFFSCIWSSNCSHSEHRRLLFPLNALLFAFGLWQEVILNPNYVLGLIHWVRIQKKLVYIRKLYFLSWQQGLSLTSFVDNLKKSARYCSSEDYSCCYECHSVTHSLALTRLGSLSRTGCLCTK